MQNPSKLLARRARDTRPPITLVGLACLLIVGCAADAIASPVAAQPTASCPASGPGALSGHVLAYNAKTEEVVLFGGLSPDPQRPFPRFTWGWNGQAWRCVTPQGPVGRIDAHLAWDAARERLVLFGGRQLTRDRQSLFLRDTWEWDGTTWTRVDTAGPGPRVHGAMAYDAARRAVVLHGGGSAEAMLYDTWEWRDGRWHTVAATIPANSLGNSLTPSAAGLVLMAAVRDSSDGCIGRRRATLLLLGANGFTPTGGAAGSGPCFSPQAPASATSDGLVLFAGWNSSDAAVPAETWAFTASTNAWRKASVSPPKRRGTAMAWDAKRSRAVLFGGEADDVLRADVWEWDGASWTQVP